MSIATYSELQTALNGADGHLHRTYSTARLQELISLAEARINRILRVRQMETALAATTISSGLITRPTDCLAVKALWSTTNNNPPVEQKSLEYVLQKPTEGSIPQFYAWDRDYFRFNSQSGSVAGVYYAPVSALSDSATTNWLLTARPDVYIACVKAESSDYLVQEDYIAATGKAESLLEEMNARDQRDRFSGNSLVVRTA